MYFFAAFCVTCYVCNQLHISIYFLVFYRFFFFLLSFLSVLFVAIVSHCPYYPSSHASVKVREGSNYWGPLGYEALKSPKSSQSPDPRSASKRARMFTFRKRKDSKIPLCQGQKRWDFVLYLCVLRGEKKTKLISHNLLSLPRELRASKLMYLFSSCGFEKRHKLNVCGVSAVLSVWVWSSQARRAEHSEGGREGALWRHQGAVACDSGKPYCKFQVTANSSTPYQVAKYYLSLLFFPPLLSHFVPTSFLVDIVSHSVVQREHSRPLYPCLRGFVKPLFKGSIFCPFSHLYVSSWSPVEQHRMNNFPKNKTSMGL